MPWLADSCSVLQRLDLQACPTAFLTVLRTATGAEDENTSVGEPQSYVCHHARLEPDLLRILRLP